MKIKAQVKNEKAANALRGPRLLKKMKPPAKKLIGTKKSLVENKIVKDVKKKIKSTKIVKKGVKTEENGAISSDLTKLDVSSDMIGKAVKIVLDERATHKKNTTIIDDTDPVYITMSWIKKPQVPDPRRHYVKLSHSIFGEDPEVCLFVCDHLYFDKVKRTPDEKIENTIEHYDAILKMHGVTGITTIMPLYQLKTEYSTYELKRKLVDRFDVFLVQSNLLENDTFFKNIGVAFTKKNKVPISLKFPVDSKTPCPKFADLVSRTLKSTWFCLKPHSDTVSMRVGHVSHTPAQLTENVKGVLHQLTEEPSEAIPGGVNNIRNIMMKTARSKAIPLYVNLAGPQSVAMPVLASVRPKIAKVKGTVSSLPGKKVAVLPSGDLMIKDNPNEQVDQELWSDDDDYIAGKKLPDEPRLEIPGKRPNAEEKESKSNKKQKMNKKAVKKEVDSDSEDEEADAAERQYLKNRGQELIEKEQVEEKTDKKVPKEKKKALRKKFLELKSQNKMKSPENKLQKKMKSLENKLQKKVKSPENKLQKKMKSPEKILQKKMKSPKKVNKAQKKQKVKVNNSPLKSPKPPAPKKLQAPVQKQEIKKKKQKA